MTKPKVTKCLSPSYREYRADNAMRAAQQRASAAQPPLMSLASKVPSYRLGD